VVDGRLIRGVATSDLGLGAVTLLIQRLENGSAVFWDGTERGDAPAHVVPTDSSMHNTFASFTHKVPTSPEPLCVSVVATARNGQ
jgi:hypothetical protein